MRFGQESRQIIFCVVCTLHLCASQIDRSGWKCITDSWQTQGGLRDCEQALDGDNNTFWHTRWDPETDAPPHFFNIDLGQVYNLTSFTYLPRQDDFKNGNIGRWQISLSADGETWRLLNDTFSDDEQLKTVDFIHNAQPAPARFLNLTAYTEAGSRGSWSSAAEFNLFDVVLPGSIDVSSVPPITTIVSSPTTSVYSTPDASTQQSSNSNSDGGDDDGGLNKVQTIGTVIGTIAAIIAVLIAIHMCCRER
ncbi:MAG: hypothetical protein L6R42_006136 [Xanthoria sp. 1 TBL-2021]|nr:MAG: hypothetical protein L6R42_006136 [Xanthoria sp. 1 TBL-2021]